MRFAEVVVVLLDAQQPFETQDLRIADLAEREGRAVVIAANKWDLEDDKSAKLASLREMAERLLPQLRGVPVVTVSALTGRGIERLQAAIVGAGARTDELRQMLEASFGQLNTEFGFVLRRADSQAG